MSTLEGFLCGGCSQTDCVCYSEGGGSITMRVLRKVTHVQAEKPIWHSIIITHVELVVAELFGRILICSMMRRLERVAVGANERCITLHVLSRVDFFLA